MTEFVAKVTPQTQVFKANFNCFDFHPTTGLVLKIGRLPPMTVGQASVEVELDAIVHVEPSLSKSFIEYMIKLGHVLKLDFAAICNGPTPPALGPDGRKNN